MDLNGVTAGSTVATLTFTVNDPTALDKINVTVTETQRNDQTVENVETLAADLHTETETVNAKAATCTEDGYTGDVVCKVCGKIITKGEVIPRHRPQNLDRWCQGAYLHRGWLHRR